MIQTVLIDRADIQQYKQMSASSFNDKLNQIVVEAQINDIKPLLGEELYNAVLKDVQTAGNTNGSTYTDLLNGVEYTVGGEVRYNPGLKSVLIQYFYGRYIMFGDIIDNPFGATLKKNNNSSQLLDYPTKKSIQIQGRDLGAKLWIDVRTYLIKTEEPLYDRCKSIVRSKFKVKKISRW